MHWFANTSAKYYHLTVGAQGQAKWAKVAYESSTYVVTDKKTHPQAKNFFFKCNLLDWPICVRR